MGTVSHQTQKYKVKQIPITSIYETIPELENLDDNFAFEDEQENRSFYGSLLKRISELFSNGNGLNGNGHKTVEIPYRELGRPNLHIRRQANYPPDEELILLSKKDFEKALSESKKEGFRAAKNATLVALKSGLVTSLIEDQAYQQDMPALASYLQRLFFPIRGYLEAVIFKAATEFWEKFEKRNWKFIDNWLTKEQGRVPCDGGLCPDEADTPVVYNGTTVKEANKKIPIEVVFKYTQEQQPGMSPTANEVATAFETVLLALESGYEGSPRRKPVRVLRVQDAFQGRETNLIPLEEIEHFFEEDGVKYPRKTAASAISWLNTNFEDLDIGLEIETVRFTGYRFRKRS